MELEAAKQLNQQVTAQLDASKQDILSLQTDKEILEASLKQKVNLSVMLFSLMKSTLVLTMFLSSPRFVSFMEWSVENSINL